MTDEEYRAYELKKARPDAAHEGDIVKLKVRSGAGESKWLNLTPAQYEAVVRLLTEAPPLEVPEKGKRVSVMVTESGSVVYLPGRIEHVRAELGAFMAVLDNGTQAVRRFKDLGVTWVYAPSAPEVKESG